MTTADDTDLYAGYVATTTGADVWCGYVGQARPLRVDAPLARQDAEWYACHRFYHRQGEGRA